MPVLFQFDQAQAYQQNVRSLDMAIREHLPIPYSSTNSQFNEMGLEVFDLFPDKKAGNKFDSATVIYLLARSTPPGIPFLSIQQRKRTTTHIKTLEFEFYDVGDHFLAVRNGYQRPNSEELYTPIWDLHAEVIAENIAELEWFVRNSSKKKADSARTA
jgi:hypothetical protein